MSCQVVRLSLPVGRQACRNRVVNSLRHPAIGGRQHFFKLYHCTNYCSSTYRTTSETSIYTTLFPLFLSCHDKTIFPQTAQAFSGQGGMPQNLRKEIAKIILELLRFALPKVREFVAGPAQPQRTIKETKYYLK